MRDDWGGIVKVAYAGWLVWESEDSVCGMVGVGE
jgi:hypothetical protein